MNSVELYAQTLVERHHEIIVSGSRFFFENGNYTIEGEDSVLRLVCSDKELKQYVSRITAALDTAKSPLSL